MICAFHGRPAQRTVIHLSSYHSEPYVYVSWAFRVDDAPEAGSQRHLCKKQAHFIHARPTLFAEMR